MGNGEWIGTVIRSIVQETVLSPRKANRIWRNIQTELPRMFRTKQYYSPRRRRR